MASHNAELCCPTRTEKVCFLLFTSLSASIPRSPRGQDTPLPMYSAGPKMALIGMCTFEPVLAKAVGGKTCRIGCGVKAYDFAISKELCHYHWLSDIGLLQTAFEAHLAIVGPKTDRLTSAPCPTALEQYRGDVSLA